MISPIRNKRPPYELPSNIIYFHDWRYVHHGSHSTGWRNKEGEWLRIWTQEEVPPLRYDPGYMPRGIRLRTRPAQKSEPFLLPAADEGFIWSGALLHDEGCYRLWYESFAGEHIGREDYPIGAADYIRYAESDDGENWRFPAQGLVERKGSKDNNIVFGLPQVAETGLHGATVFKDPSAPAAERYKMIYVGNLSPAMKERYQRDRPDEVGALNLEQERWDGLFGAVSADGFSWTPLPDPCVAQISDTHNVCEYDPVLGQYVAYCRSHYFNRRTIGRTASEDFRRMPLSEEVFWPDAAGEPYDLWYANAKSKMPGTTDYHVMFPLRWRLLDDSFSFALAASPDNVVWNFVPGGPVCEPGETGTWVGGAAAPGVGLVDLPGGRTGMTMVGSPEPHKHLRQPPHGHIAWATWPRGRLVALEAPEEGSFRTFTLKIPQRRVHLNFRTPPGGYVQVQVMDQKYNPLQGRTFEDCDWLVGDHLDREVSWKGETDLGHEGEGPISLGFRLQCAELFSVEFKSP